MKESKRERKSLRICNSNRWIWEKKNQKGKRMVRRVTVRWGKKWGKRLKKDGWCGAMRGGIIKNKNKKITWHNEKLTKLIAKPQLLYIVYKYILVTIHLWIHPFLQPCWSVKLIMNMISLAITGSHCWYFLFSKYLHQSQSMQLQQIIKMHVSVNLFFL